MATAQPRKSILWQILKANRDAGVPLDLSRPYVTWTESDLEDLMRSHNIAIPVDEDAPIPGFEEAAALVEDEWAARAKEIRSGQADAGARGGAEPRDVAASVPVSAPVSQGDTPARRPVSGPLAMPLAGVSPRAQAAHLEVPLADRGEDRAGLHFNDSVQGKALRVDSRGRVWYQDEVQKPAIPKPRVTRTTQFVDPGVKVVHTNRPDGGLDETFEVAGEESRIMQTKVTLPSWQVGIFIDLRYPFKVHIYNDVEGFDFNDVVTFYGGIELVPSTIKRKYVGNDLCFDMRTTRTTMEQEHRDMQLQGRIN